MTKAGSKKKRKDMEKIQTIPPLDSTPSQMRKVQNPIKHYNQETVGNEIAECGNNTKNCTHWLST